MQWDFLRMEKPRAGSSSHLPASCPSDGRGTRGAAGQGGVVHWDGTTGGGGERGFPFIQPSEQGLEARLLSRKEERGLNFGCSPGGAGAPLGGLRLRTTPPPFEAR